MGGRWTNIPPTFGSSPPLYIRIGYQYHAVADPTAEKCNALLSEGPKLIAQDGLNQ